MHRADNQLAKSLYWFMKLILIDVYLYCFLEGKEEAEEEAAAGAAKGKSYP